MKSSQKTACSKNKHIVGMGFLHLTLQEYFVAQYAVDQQYLETLIQRRDNPWWEEALFLYAGRVADAGPLLQQLLGTIRPDSVQDDLFHTDLILAGRCLVAYPTIRQAPLREEVITRLFRVLSSTRYRLILFHQGKDMIVQEDWPIGPIG